MDLISSTYWKEEGDILGRGFGLVTSERVFLGFSFSAGIRELKGFYGVVVGVDDFVRCFYL